MIYWKFTKVVRPADKQSCFITQERTELLSVPIIGPISYQKDGDLFLDLFATEEAGSLYQAGESDLWWCAEEELNLPNENVKESGT